MTSNEIANKFYLMCIGPGESPQTEDYSFTAYNVDFAKEVFYELHKEDIYEYARKHYTNGKCEACGCGITVCINIKNNKIHHTEFTVEVECEDGFIDFIDADVKISDELAHALINLPTE